MVVVNNEYNYQLRNGEETSHRHRYLPDRPAYQPSMRWSIANDPQQGKLTAEAARHLANYSQLMEKADLIEPTYDYNRACYHRFINSPTRVLINRIATGGFYITVLAMYYGAIITSGKRRALSNWEKFVILESIGGIPICQGILYLNTYQEPGKSPTQIRDEADTAYEAARQEMLQRFQQLSDYDSTQDGPAGINPFTDLAPICQHLADCGFKHQDASEIASALLHSNVRRLWDEQQLPAILNAQLSSNPNRDKLELTTEAAGHLATYNQLMEKADSIEPTYAYDKARYKRFQASCNPFWINDGPLGIKTFLASELICFTLAAATAAIFKRIGTKNPLSSLDRLGRISACSFITLMETGVSYGLVQCIRCQDPGESPEEIRARANAAYDTARREMHNQYAGLSPAEINPFTDLAPICQSLEKSGFKHQDASEISCALLHPNFRMSWGLQQPNPPAYNPAWQEEQKC